MHILNHKRKGKKDYMSLKLDMSEAYDRVNCDFLEEVMNKMGINSKMV